MHEKLALHAHITIFVQVLLEGVFVADYGNGRKVCNRELTMFLPVVLRPTFYIMPLELPFK